MNILICGATGFVGKHLAASLQRSDHHIIRAVRTPTQVGDVAVDFRNDDDMAIWLPRLQGIDVVINAVGVLRDNNKNPMRKLHSATPCALFSACAQAGVSRIVHLSALGIDSGIAVPYFSTRLQAEAALSALPERIRTLCLRPSVVYGMDGASAQLFKQLAKLPLQLLPMGGVQTLQPVHIDDICSAVTRWLADPHAQTLRVDTVGAEATTMRGMLDSYREQLGHRPAWHLAMPRLVVRGLATVGDYIPAAPLCSDTYAMLAAGNTASPANFTTLLGHAPRSYRDFIRN